MAVSAMSAVSILGSMKDLDKVVNTCGKSGVFQPDNINSFYSDTENFSSVADENPYISPLRTLTNVAASCGQKLNTVDVQKITISQSKIDRFINSLSKKMELLTEQKRDFYAQLENCRSEIKKLKHFYGLDQTLKDVLSGEYVKARFGRIPKENYDRFLKQKEESEIELLFFPLTFDGEYQWGFYFADAGDLNETDRVFSSYYFEKIEIEPYDKTPYEKVVELENEIKVIYKKIEDTEKQIAELWSCEKSECIKIYSKLEELNTYSEIKNYVARYNESFILVGWVPSENEKEFCAKINKIKSTECSTEKAENLLKNSPPIKLKNKRIFRPFEFLINMYGMPSYDEIDPTIFVGITYTVLFGIMFADLGQGIVLSIIGYFMWKWKKMPMGKILIGCGIFSAIFGTLLGSVFGFEHLLDPFYKNVFGLHEKPIEVMASATTSLVIYIAIGLGAVLFIIAMMLGVYSSIKRKHYGEAIFSSHGLCGLVFYAAVIFMVVDMLLLHTGVINGIYIALLLILPAVLLMFQEILIKLVNKEPDWKPESWGEYFMQGFFELFEVLLSFITNTLSFSRVGAFVLVHAGMMMAVFKIAEMFGPFGFTVSVIIGNAFVIALEALLTGIQVMRLEFYEMFSKFFGGQGRAFSPVVVQENTN